VNRRLDEDTDRSSPKVVMSSMFACTRVPSGHLFHFLIGAEDEARGLLYKDFLEQKACGRR
jgi:hypothetical protein